MASVAENVKTCLYNNWNDSVGVAKDDIHWTVYRADIVASWLRSGTKNFLIAVYSPGQTVARMISPSTWRVEETVRIDIMVKCNASNIGEMYQKRNVLKSEVMRIIHAYQFQIPNLSWAYISQEPIEVEAENLLRTTFYCLCVYHHVS
jgi:hypothetical protein